jgi:putative transposon-encoded protein
VTRENISQAFNVSDDKKKAGVALRDRAPTKVKLEIYGEEMIEKRVTSSGNSGRVYLPPDWVGRHVKIIRIE